jgi:hypothetical protein
MRLWKSALQEARRLDGALDIVGESPVPARLGDLQSIHVGQRSPQYLRVTRTQAVNRDRGQMGTVREAGEVLRAPQQDRT